MILDPVTMALVQNRLDHITKQMGWVMTRTARSPIFNHAHDFSCFLVDRDGVIVAQADGIPIHTGGGGFAARALLETFGDDMAADAAAMCGVGKELVKRHRRSAIHGCCCGATEGGADETEVGDLDVVDGHRAVGGDV